MCSLTTRSILLKSVRLLSKVLSLSLLVVGHFHSPNLGLHGSKHCCKPDTCTWCSALGVLYQLTNLQKLICLCASSCSSVIQHSKAKYPTRKHLKLRNAYCTGLADGLWSLVNEGSAEDAKELAIVNKVCQAL